MAGSIELRPEQNSSPAPELVSSKELFSQAISLLNRYSVPFLNPLLQMFGVGKISGLCTPYVEVTNKRSGKSFDVTIAQRFVGEDSDSCYLLFKREGMEMPAVWFIIKEESVLNYRLRKIISQRVLQNIQDLITRVGETIR